ncbi:hypothetical protein GCM10010156_25850 [Planobispora rosea]|uniref:CobQ/CobB/MinD/ParA nucleotide binding domain-containing protein n=1 Tax=Planobispora rosea TaxID=35762 RepID=A0A8J3WEG8_PLARO|nr:TcpE family conjugal transfer membrane protein [Planobispora rosea]GGS65733.1 hypothetical protein GCM10010156_25850 [Planobispora rosea]GIH84946.1 hypothetical protein Pro02_33540 [Planobispora rosea]
MDLPTYTNIWRIEKRLYKLYDLRLPMPLPIVWIGVFVGVMAPWSLLLWLVGVDFGPPWHVVYLVPPGVVTWLSTRPVIENKRLTELLQSQVRYLGEPRTWCRMAPAAEPAEITLTGRVWRAAPQQAAPVRVKTARKARHAQPKRVAAPSRAVRPAVAAAAAAAAGAPVTRDRVVWGSAYAPRRGTAPALGQAVAASAESPAVIRERPPASLPERPQTGIPERPPVRFHETPPAGTPDRPLTVVPETPLTAASEPPSPLPADPAPAVPVTAPDTSVEPEPEPAESRPDGPEPAESTLTAPESAEPAEPASSVTPVPSTPATTRPAKRAPAGRATPVDTEALRRLRKLAAATGPDRFSPPPSPPSPPAQVPGVTPDGGGGVPVVPERTRAAAAQGVSESSVASQSERTSAADIGRAAATHGASESSVASQRERTSAADGGRAAVQGVSETRAASRQQETSVVEDGGRGAVPRETSAGKDAGKTERASVRRPAVPDPGESHAAEARTETDESILAQHRKGQPPTGGERKVWPPARPGLAPGNPMNPGNPANPANSGNPVNVSIRAVPRDASPADVPVPGPGQGQGQGQGETRVRRVESVVGRDSEGGWRRLAQVVMGPGGGRTDGSEVDEARARGVFSGSRRVVVLGCTGGAGQTTTALMLGHTLARYREDRVLAVDAGTGAHALSSRIQGESPETLSSLLAGLDRVHGYLGMRAYTSRCASGLEVLAGDADAGAEQRMADRALFSDRRLGRAMDLLDEHYKLIIMDPAAALAARVLPHADQLVLVVPASEDGPDAVAMTYEWLDGHGCADLRRRAVMVVNGVSRRSMNDVEQAEAVARGRCRAIVRVPWEDELAPGRSDRVEPSHLRAPGRRAYLALAGVVVAGFGAARTARMSEEEVAQ